MSVESAPTASSGSKEFKPASPLTRADSGVGADPKISSDSELRPYLPASPLEGSELVRSDTVDGIGSAETTQNEGARRPGRPPKSAARRMDIVAKVADIVDVDQNGRGRRPDGKFLSNYQMDVIAANADRIRNHPPSSPDLSAEPQDISQNPRAVKTPEEVTVRNPDYAYNTIEIGGVTYERGQDVRFVSEEDRRAGRNEGRLYVVVTGTIEDSPGLVLQDPENPSLVFAVDADTAEQWAKPGEVERESDDNTEFSYQGQNYNVGDKVSYTTNSGKVIDCIVLGTDMNGEGMVLQSVNDPGSPDDDQVFRINGRPVTLIAAAPVGPSGQNPGVAPTEPTPEPTPEPTSEPTPGPSPEPTPEPTSEPTPGPSPEPTPGQPTEAPDGEQPPEIEPAQTQESSEPLVLLVADTKETDLRLAKIEADRRIDQELRELREELYVPNYNGPSKVSRFVRYCANFVRSSFMHPIKSFRYLAMSNPGRDSYRERYKAQKMRELQGPNIHSAVAQETAERFTVGEEFLFEGEEMLRQENPEVRELKDQLNALFQQAIAEGRPRADVMDAAHRIMAGASWIEQGSDGEVHMLQNLEVIYDRITTAVDHEAGLAAIDAAYELVGGKTTLGAEAEARETTTDRIMEKLTNSRLKALVVNEATVAIAVGTVVGVLGYLARGKLPRVVAGALLGGPALIVAAAGSAGLFAAARERRTIKQERAMEMDRVALGGSIGGEEAETGPRRTEVDATLYDMVAASELITSIGSSIPDDPSSLTEEQATRLFSEVAILRANQTLGDQHRVDLIRYTSEELCEQEKTQLVKLRARAEQLLATYAQQHPDFMQQVQGATISEKLALAQSLRAADVRGHISQRDSAFRRLSMKRATTRGLTTFAFAAAGSFISRAISDWKGEGAPSGKAEVLDNHRQHLTMRGDSLDLPKGWKLQGSSLIDTDGRHITDNFHYGPNGSVAPQTMLELRNSGIKFHDAIETRTITTTREVPFDEYVRLHPEKLHTIHRDGWMGNNTPMWQDSAGKWHGADLNELGGRFSTDGHGNIILGTSPMTDSGSFQEAISVAAHSEQVAGKLRWILTPDRSHPTSSIVLEVNPDGSLLIPKGSLAHSLFDIDPSGRVTLHSGYAEVAFPTGRIGHNGGEGYYILATQVGNNAPKSVPLTETSQMFVHHGTLIATNKPDVDPFPIFLPIAAPLPRRPLERIIPRAEAAYIASPYQVGYYGAEFTAENNERARARFSSRLRENPEALLEPKQEIEDYMSRMGTARIAELEGMASEIEPMDETCKISVMIPVNGAQEGENIYTTLKWYTGQVDDNGNPLDPSTYEVVLFVNKPDDMQWDSTLDEIERFRRDFPGMPIRVIRREYPRSEARIGKIRKDLADLTILRQSKRQSAEEVVLVSNDADCKGLGQTYLDTIITQMDTQSADALSGRLEWDPAANTESPLYHMGVKIMQTLELLDRHPRPESGREPRYGHSGANFAYKSSIYAAVGGYDSDTSLGEDVVLGKTIKLAREGATSRSGIVFYGGDNIVYTDSRRGIAAFNAGYPPALQWSQVSFGPADQVRDGVELQDAINYDLLLKESPRGIEKVLQRKERAKFEAELKKLLEETVMAYGILPADTEYREGMAMPYGVESVMRMLEALRIEASVDVTKGVFRINSLNISRIYEYLRHYRTAGPRAYAARTGLARVFPESVPEAAPELPSAA